MGWDQKHKIQLGTSYYLHAPRIAAGPILCNCFINGLYDGRAQMILNQVEWLIHQSHLDIQRDLNKVVKWDDRKFMTSNKHQILHLGRNSLMHRIVGSWPAVKKLCRELLLSPSWPQADHEGIMPPLAKQARNYIGSVRRSLSHRPRKALRSPHQEFWAKYWAPQYRGGMKILERAQ